MYPSFSQTHHAEIAYCCDFDSFYLSEWFDE